MAASTSRWRRPLILLAACAGIWAAAIAVTGGFAYRSGWIRLSSQNPVDPALIALASAAIVALLDWKTGGPRTARALTALVAGLGSALVLAQWADARPLWLDEEMIALNFRDRSFGMLSGRLWLEQSAPLGWLVLQRISLLTLGSGELRNAFVVWRPASAVRDVNQEARDSGSPSGSPLRSGLRWRASLPSACSQALSSCRGSFLPSFASCLFTNGFHSGSSLRSFLESRCSPTGQLYSQAQSRQRTVTFAAMSVLVGAISFSSAATFSAVASTTCLPPGRQRRTDTWTIDRRSHWLMAQRQPGDVIITTKLGLPAMSTRCDHLQLSF